MLPRGGASGGARLGDACGRGEGGQWGKARPRLPGMRAGKEMGGRLPQRWARHLIWVQVAWIALVCGLGGWWVSLMHSQAGRIAILEQQAGLAASAVEGQWLRTQRMLFWEGGAFFAALMVSLGALAILHWRDAARARALQAFFASATHELRTPLAALRLEVEGMAGVIRPGHEGRPWVDRMLEDAARLESQVERALELARIEGGGRVPVQAVNLRAVVAEFVRTWRPPPGREVVVSNDAEDAGVMGNAASVHTMMRNLFENSVRHGCAGAIRISVRSESRQGCVLLTVADDGGPARSLPPRLGELFSRGEDSAGAGVGLYLVRGLMRRMGGEAGFEATDRGFVAHLSFKREAQDG